MNERATQKLIDQSLQSPNAAITPGETTGFTAGSGTATKVDSTYTGNVGTTAYTLSDIVKALKNLGVLPA